MVIVTMRMRTAIPIPIPTWFVIPPLSCVPSISPPLFSDWVGVGVEVTDVSVAIPFDAGVGAIVKSLGNDIA
jgi:hypothetical protein